MTSWHPAGAPRPPVPEPARAFRAGTSIRGGVPVCFPQFADQGPLPMHGFARDMRVGLAAAGCGEDGAAQARFRLDRFGRHARDLAACFRMRADGDGQRPALAVELAVTNTGPLVRVHDGAAHVSARARRAQVRVRGLSGAIIATRCCSTTTLRGRPSSSSIARSIASIAAFRHARSARARSRARRARKARPTPSCGIPDRRDRAGPADTHPTRGCRSCASRLRSRAGRLHLRAGETWRGVPDPDRPTVTRRSETSP